MTAETSNQGQAKEDSVSTEHRPIENTHKGHVGRVIDGKLFIAPVERTVDGKYVASAFREFGEK